MVDWNLYDAVLLDLDGVITDTARIHARCWKETFDEFLRRRAEVSGEQFQAFDIESDYRLYVDGKPRLAGVRDFLRSRGIELPEGGPDDPPEAETVHGIGNRKNALVAEFIRPDTVEVYASSVDLVKRLRAAGKKTAVVSSSANTPAVLEAAGISHLFDTRVDGVTAARDGLPGKPAPDTFIAAARALGVDLERCAVVEDAISGVQAARAGNFGLVIGIARHDEPEALRAHGADVVVSDLAELAPDGA
jgi:beta-phosphoglucomutase family hydrolase